ncbi:hypothetical protein [Bradyrhizobium cenepequi]
MNTKVDIDDESAPVEILSPTDISLAVGLTTAEIDQQIATAHKWPRSMKRVSDKILELATLDEETAEECMYSVPRDGKTIEGPSARFAEIIFSQWGNCRVVGRTVRDEHESVVAQAVFHDLEANAALATEEERRVVNRKGKRYSVDGVINTKKAAISIARRNVILAGVPKAVWRRAYNAARQVVMGDLQTLANRRAAAMTAFQRFGVVPAQIFAVLNVPGEEDITLDHLVTLRGMLAALKNEEATVEQIFPRQERERDGGDPNYNPLVRNTAGATDQQTAGGANEVTGDSQQGQTHRPDASETENRSGADQQNGQAGEKPATDSGQGTSGATQSRDQASASPAPADAGTSQSDNGSSQPDLLSGTEPPAGSKAQPSESQPSAEGADKGSRGGTTGSAPDLSSYHKTLATIENGGPPKLGKMSDSWINKNGKFAGAQEKKRAEIYAVHVERLTGAIDMAACNKRVEGIIAK